MTIPDDYDPNDEHGLSQEELEEQFDTVGEDREGSGRPTSADLDAPARVWGVLERTHRVELESRIEQAGRTAETLTERFENHLDELETDDATGRGGAESNVDAGGPRDG